MTLLLVLLTLTLVLAVEYILEHRRSKTVIGSPATVKPPVFEIPTGVDLTVNHIWIKNEPHGVITIGIDELLGRVIGKVERLVLPNVDSMVTPATKGVKLCSKNRSLNLASPVTGKVTHVNHNLIEDPSLARHDPYGAGWMFKLIPKSDRPDLNKMFVVSGPAEWLKRQAEQIRDFFAAHAPARLSTLQDGGTPAESLLQAYDVDVWDEFAASFAALRRKGID